MATAAISIPFVLLCMVLAWGYMAWEHRYGDQVRAVLAQAAERRAKRRRKKFRAQIRASLEDHR